MKKKRTVFSRITVLLFTLLALTLTPADLPLPVSVVHTVQAAVKLNAQKKTLTKGQTFTLKLIGTKKKVSWTSSNKSVASVSKKGVVKASKKGTAVITAKTGKKKYTCKITVKNPTASTPSSKTAFNKLANYILSNGTLDKNANKSLIYSGTSDGITITWTISYNAKTKHLQFVMDGSQPGSLATTVTMDLDNASAYITPTCYFSENTSSTYFYTKAKIKKAQYKASKTFRFTAVQNSAGLGSKDLTELSCQLLTTAFDGWNRVLLPPSKVTLKQLGFTSY